MIETVRYGSLSGKTIHQVIKGLNFEGTALCGKKVDSEKYEPDYRTGKACGDCYMVSSNLRHIDLRLQRLLQEKRHKVSVYERILHQLYEHSWTGYGERYAKLMELIFSWGRAHTYGNGEVTEEERETTINNCYLRIKKFLENPNEHST